MPDLCGHHDWIHCTPIYFHKKNQQHELTIKPFTYLFFSFVVNAAGKNLPTLWYKYTVKLKIDYRSVIFADKTSIFSMFQMWCIFKILSFSIWSLLQLQVLKVYHQQKLFMSSHLSRVLNSYKVVINFATYHIVKAEWTSWAGPRHMLIASLKYLKFWVSGVMFLLLYVACIPVIVSRITIYLWFTLILSLYTHHLMNLTGSLTQL